jgi:hypothetical protein
MLLSATLVLLGFWLIIVWHFDIDGFRRHRRRGTSREDPVRREERATPCDNPEDL